MFCTNPFVFIPLLSIYLRSTAFLETLLILLQIHKKRQHNYLSLATAKDRHTKTLKKND